MRLARLYHHHWLLIRLPLLLAACLVIAMLWRLHPMPPTRLTITTAESNGAYYRNALRYAEHFAARGVQLDVLTSAGSQQNLERLQQADSPADLAFMQGGLGYLRVSSDSRDRSRIETLANVDVEPVWLFSRQHEIDTLAQLRGLRLALGPQGGGSREIGLQLLAQARLSSSDVVLSSQAGHDAVQALRSGAVDVVLMVASPDSVAVQAMLGLPGIRLANLRQSTAITERNPYLEQRLLPQGSLDTRLPPHDLTLLTTSASLVTRDSLHPALQRLALAVAMEVHPGGGLFHRAGDFPSLRQIDFPTAPGARSTLLHGRPWLEDKLPFWWAQVAERLLLIVLPVALLTWWLMRLLSGWLRWAVESRVNRWYGELKFIENDLSKASVSGLDVTRFAQRLDAIDRAMLAFPTPRELMSRCFMLHQHIEFVRQRLDRVRGR